MAGLHEAEICLRVVGLVPQEGKQDSTCAGFFDRLFRRLDSHKNRVDPRQTGERRLDFLDLVAICEVLNMSIVKFAERFEIARKLK